MSARKPPALANWLLDRFGLTRQNPPLTGDLLEEFRSGRSAAWYWRQTLVVVSTGLARNLRRFWRRLTGAFIGWAAQAGLTFVLWRLHFPPILLAQPWGKVAELIIPIGLILIWKKGYRKLRGGFADPEGLLMSACASFAWLLTLYCASGLRWSLPSLGDFIFLQAWYLFFFGVIDPLLL